MIKLKLCDSLLIDVDVIFENCRTEVQWGTIFSKGLPGELESLHQLAIFETMSSNSI